MAISANFPIICSPFSPTSLILMPLDGFLHPSDFRVYDACEIEGYCGLHQAGAQEMSMVHRPGFSVTLYTIN